MPIKRLAIYTLLAAIIAATSALIVRQAVIDNVPQWVMKLIQDRMADGGDRWNTCSHTRTYGPVHGGVSRANPDSMVSVMAYDLSRGPVRVSGETWPNYWSLSLYQDNTDNYFVINDRELETSSFDFIISYDDEVDPAEQAQHITSPTETGVMVIRRFVRSSDELPAVLANQDKMYCGPVITGS